MQFPDYVSIFVGNEICLMKRLLLIALSVFYASIVCAQSSKGTATASLEGRNLVGSIPYLTSTGSFEGVIVLDIWVDQYGNITRATSGAEGTTIENTRALSSARDAAMKAHFNQDANAPTLQRGTITYVFQLIDDEEREVLDTPSATRKITNISDAFTFRGIPIDGAKRDVVTALKDSGFEHGYECLNGEFNGENVEVRVHTHQEVVDRIEIDFPSEDEQTLRVKYNNLISRYKRSSKYISLVAPTEIPSAEGIKSDLVSKKYYDATFFQLKSGVDAKSWKSEVSSLIAKSSGVPVGKLSHEELEEQLNRLPKSLTSSIVGIVWLTLDHYYFLDRIVLFYDNYRNRPRGEDL